MDLRPSGQTNRISANQEFPRILWNQNTNYRIHKLQPNVPIRNQINPAHGLIQRPEHQF